VKYKISRRGKALLIKTIHEGENAEEEHFSCLLFSVWGWNKRKNQTQYLQLEIVLRPRRISNEK
jgi:hypothetical protein